MMNIAVIIPVHNRKEITLNFLKQFVAISTSLDEVCFSIIIVDDGSTDGTSERIAERYPEVTILRGNGNLWWTGAVRKGAEFALQGGFDSVLIMNDDLDLDKNVLSELLKVYRKYPGALVSSIKLDTLSGTRERIITAGARVVGLLGQMKPLHTGEPYTTSIGETLECEMLTGSSLLIPVKVFGRIGLFDDKKFPHHWGDFEFTRRASLAGFRCLVATRSKVYTQYNPNYALPYLLTSTRREYLRNLFDSRKYFYGFKSTAKASYMHKNFCAGTIVFLKGLLGLSKRIALKIVLPNRILKKIMQKDAFNDAEFSETREAHVK
jgi:GT2 family glycosyltransferase